MCTFQKVYEVSICISCRLHSEFMHLQCAVADPGFPERGADRVGGCQGPIQRHCGKLVCKNKIIWMLRGGERRQRPLDPSMMWLINLPLKFNILCLYLL